MSLTNQILERLETENIKPERFQEIVVRLFAWGIVVRDADGTEQRLYDDALRIEGLLTEYFALAGFRLVHDLKNDFFRLYAPGVQIPGQADDDFAPVPSLRAKLSADFVAAALALRFLFQQGLVEGGGKLADTGEVLIRFDELAATLQTQIKRPLPEGAGERDRLLRDLRRHRLIHLGQSFDISNEDALIAIRPTILGIISEDALEAAIEAGGDIDVQDENSSQEALG